VSWPVYQLVAQRDVERLRERLRADGYALRELDGSRLRGATGLWTRAGEAFGFSGVDGWDSFSDRMWAAMLPDDDEDDKVALVWEHADGLLPHGLGAFLEAYDVLVTIARQAYAQQVDVTILLLGDGEGFPPLT
jgi:hypothetical protein